jgi:DNA-binding CsgD family transcriptional regulator
VTAHHRLTRNQLAALLLVAEGRSYAEAGELLDGGIDENAVRKRISAAQEKLGSNCQMLWIGA